jgi:hypothetical protein
LPERIDGDASDARLAAKVQVVGRLHSGLADAVAGGVAVLGAGLELLLRDLTHVAEDLRGDPALVVPAQRDLVDLHAGEVVLVLEEVIDLGVRDVRADRDGREEVVLPRRQVALDAAVGHVEEARDTTKRLLPLLGSELVQGGRPELRHRARHVGHEHLAVPVEDGASRRGSAEGAHLVVARFVEVLLAGDDLERPEAEEEDAEDGDREDAEDRDPQGELWGQAIGLLDPRVRR